MIILEIIGGLLVLFLAAQILGRLARFVWIPILSSVIAGLVVGISNHSLWGGIGSGSHRIWYIECYCWRQLTFTYYKRHGEKNLQI